MYGFGGASLAPNVPAGGQWLLLGALVGTSASISSMNATTQNDSTEPLRAIGVVRQSDSKGRKDGASPREQRAQLERRGETDGYRLLRVLEEIDVSGYRTPLAKRRGLLAAIEAVEAGEADLIVVAYFDRLMRSLRVQAEVVERVEAAGGKLLALDSGAISNGTSAQWLSSTMLGMVAEHHSRITGEKSRPAQADAVARGVAPFSAPVGYDRDPDTKRLVPNGDAELVADAFDRRAAGATVREVWQHLADAGVEVSYSQTGKLLGSRTVLGEVHFGGHSNTAAHDPIVERPVWERVQRQRVPAGRRGKSERLLARLGVLVCGTCGSRMIASTKPTAKGPYPFYRCPGYNTTGCPDRPTIAAELVERIVAGEVRETLADAVGRRSAVRAVRDAERRLEATQVELDAAVRVALGAGVADEQATVDELARLRKARDAAQKRVDRLDGAATSATISPATDWDRLTFGGRRALVRTLFDRVVVAPGRGEGRVSFEAFGE